VALRKGPSWLAADHENAALLANALAELTGIALDVAVKTNILVFRISAEFFGGAAPPEGPTNAFLARLKEAGVLASPVDHERARLVTHRDVSRRQVEEAIARMRRCAGVAVGA
jgi:threonine aldolase